MMREVETTMTVTDSTGKPMMRTKLSSMLKASVLSLYRLHANSMGDGCCGRSISSGKWFYVQLVGMYVHFNVLRDACTWCTA